MKPTLLASLLFVALAAEPLAPVAVWNGAPPSETLKLKPGSDPKGTINPKTLGRTDVFTPEFVPWPAAKPNSPIVIICPGGGYGGLAEQHEGVAVAGRGRDASDQSEHSALQGCQGGRAVAWHLPA